MPGIKVREHEPFESVIRRFKRVVEKSGILSEMRKREYHETRSEMKKRAHAAAIKRFRKKQSRESRGEKGSRGSRGGSTPTSTTGNTRGGSSNVASIGGRSRS